MPKRAADPRQQVPRYHVSPRLKHMPLEKSISHKIRRVNRGLMRSLEARIAPAGIPTGGWFFLRVLWDQDDLSQAELSEKTGVMGPTTMNAIRRLERLGLVTQTRSHVDKRKAHVRLTAAGRALEPRMIPKSIEVMNLALSGFTRDEVETLRRLIERMALNLERDAVVVGRAPAARGTEAA